MITKVLTVLAQLFPYSILIANFVFFDLLKKLLIVFLRI